MTAMKQLPDAAIYEEGLKYWPYRDSLDWVLRILIKGAPQGGRVLDVMCGPGWLLGKLKERRPDLVLVGVDNDERYVSYGRQTYSDISFEHGDVLTWVPERQFDRVVCTGALHHLRYDFQGRAIANIASMVQVGGEAVISDCYVDDYATEEERKFAAAKLGYEYLLATIAHGAPDKVVEWTMDILHNDVLMHEYKPSLAQRSRLLNKHFLQVVTAKAWPAELPEEGMPLKEGGYGDYIHVCKVGVSGKVLTFPPRS